MKTGRKSAETAALDSRARRSRDAMHAALLRLLEGHALEDISIRHIAAEAGVGHATFYRHYPSKEALLDDVAAGEMDRLIQLSLAALVDVDPAAASLVLCNYVHEHWSLWSTLLTGGAAAAMKAELLALTQGIASDWPPTKHRLPTDLRIALATATVIEVLAWWLRQPKPLPVADAAPSGHSCLRTASCQSPDRSHGCRSSVPFKMADHFFPSTDHPKPASGADLGSASSAVVPLSCFLFRAAFQARQGFGTEPATAL